MFWIHLEFGDLEELPPGAPLRIPGRVPFSEKVVELLPSRKSLPGDDEILTAPELLSLLRPMALTLIAACKAKVYDSCTLCNVGCFDFWILHTCIHTHTYVHTYLCTYMPMYIQTYVHTHIHTYLLAYKHAHIQVGFGIGVSGVAAKLGART